MHLHFVEKISKHIAYVEIWGSDYWLSYTQFTLDRIDDA